LDQERKSGESKLCLKPEEKKVFAENDAPLKENDVCYRSTPDFGGKSKACAEGLVCRFKVNQEGKTGGAKLCLKPEEKKPLPKLMNH